MKIPGSDNDARMLAGTEWLEEVQGVYAKYPAMSPKYHTGNDRRLLERQARMYIAVPPSIYPRLYKLIPARSQQILEVLCPQSDRNGVGFFDFLIQQISFQTQEKVQISQVLSDGHVAYFFGQRPIQLSISGGLLNTKQDPWYDVFYLLYEDILRGTLSSRRRTPTRLRFDNREVTGSLLGMSQAITADMELMPSFQMTMLVDTFEVIDPVWANDLGARGNVTVPFTNPPKATEELVALYDSLEAGNLGVPPLLDDIRPGFDPAEVSERVNEKLGEAAQQVGGVLDRAFSADEGTIKRTLSFFSR